MPTDITAHEVDPFLIHTLNTTVSELARRHGEHGLFFAVLQAAMAARTLGLPEAEMVQPLLAVTRQLSPVGLAKRDEDRAQHIRDLRGKFRDSLPSSDEFKQRRAQ